MLMYKTGDGIPQDIELAKEYKKKAEDIRDHVQKDKGKYFQKKMTCFFRENDFTYFSILLFFRKDLISRRFRNCRRIRNTWRTIIH